MHLRVNPYYMQLQSKWRSKHYLNIWMECSTSSLRVLKRVLSFLRMKGWCILVRSPSYFHWVLETAPLMIIVYSSKEPMHQSLPPTIRKQMVQEVRTKKTLIIYFCIRSRSSLISNWAGEGMSTIHDHLWLAWEPWLEKIHCRNIHSTLSSRSNHAHHRWLWLEA